MLKLFDTLSRRKRAFRPLKGNLVRVYTCGPSVYDYTHIGNFRTYLFEDILVRYLGYKGFRVKRVMNITDIEDKAIAAAKREGKTFRELEKGKIRAFFSDFRKLGMARPDIVAKASGNVRQMITLIERICAKGYCIREKDGVYFDVRRFRGYGHLRGLKSRAYLGKAKGDDYSREGLWDFRLWKRWTPADGDARWSSPFGTGRPGWHIECSAMSMRYLGESFDIHCGGVDNIFPHHENEIAQSESATGKRLANFWLHARHLTIGKRKMSKRTGNVLYVEQLMDEGIEPRCLRYYLISARYRSPLSLTMRGLRDEICACGKARGIIKRLGKAIRSGHDRLGRAIGRRLLKGFEGAMDDDLNTSLAFKRIFRLLGQADRALTEGEMSRDDARLILDAVDRIDSVLRVF